MTNLILVHPDDQHNITKTIVDIDNWGVMGRIGEKFYLVTSDCKVYHINDLTIKKFLALIKRGLEMTRPGIFDTISLVCPKCGGKGITDWVSDVVGNKIGGVDIPNFKSNSDIPTLKIKVKHNTKFFPVYVRRAIVPEAHEHCTECGGSGLFITTADYDMSNRKREYKSL